MAPTPIITVQKNDIASGRKGGTSYSCSANGSYSEAQIHWELNTALQKVDAYTIKQQSIFSTVSTITGDFQETDQLVCIVAHPVFREPMRIKVNRADLHQAGKSITEGSFLDLDMFGKIHSFGKIVHLPQVVQSTAHHMAVGTYFWT